MKKFTLTSFLVIVFSMSIQAQSTYTGAVGLGIDLFEGATLVGPSGKYFFTENSAGQIDLGFEDELTAITVLYSYHKEFAGATGLQWFAGVGPTIFLPNDEDAAFALRPHVGLDFKIQDVPLAFSASWRPLIGLSSVFEGDRFEAGAFALGFRYAFD